MNPGVAAAIGAAADFGMDQLSGAIEAGRNRRFWREQNAYNHPRAQMQRLEEAGLNPNLVYGSKSGGASGNAGPIGRSVTPNTSRYQDARIKSAQADLVQTNADLAVQKLEQARISTDIQKRVHAYMSDHPESIVTITGPDGTEITTSRTSEMDRYQTQSQARHQIILNQAQMSEIDKIVKGETSLEQAYAKLTQTQQQTATERQRTQALLNNNRLWSVLDDLVHDSANPHEVLAIILKMLLASAGAKTD